MILFYHSVVFKGADDVRQLYDADDAELLEILSLVGMTKPVHIKRFQRYLQNWGENQGRNVIIQISPILGRSK